MPSCLTDWLTDCLNCARRRMFKACNTKTRHWTQSCGSLGQFTPQEVLTLRSILILSNDVSIYGRALTSLHRKNVNISLTWKPIQKEKLILFMLKILRIKNKCCYFTYTDVNNLFTLQSNYEGRNWRPSKFSWWTLAFSYGRRFEEAPTFWKRKCFWYLQIGHKCRQPINRWQWPP